VLLLREVLDEILNALLFVLLGLEVLVLPVRREYVLAGVLAIVVLLSWPASLPRGCRSSWPAWSSRRHPTW